MLIKSKLTFALALFFFIISSVSNTHAVTSTRYPTPSPRPTSCTTPIGKISINASTCNGNILFKCSSSANLSYLSCPYGCANNACKSRPLPTPTPRPTSCSFSGGRIYINTSTCYSNSIVRCSSVGTLSYTSCPYGCANNACKSRPLPTPTARPITPTPRPIGVGYTNPTQVCCNGQGISGCRCSNGSELTSACGSYYIYCHATPTARPITPTPRPVTTSGCTNRGGVCRPSYTCQGNYHVISESCASGLVCCAPIK